MADILVSKYNENSVVACYIDNRLEHLSVLHDSDRGDVYLCRVENIVKNISAAFVRYGDGNTGYVPFKSILSSNVCNREIASPDEIRQGDEVILQVETEAQKLKQAKLTSYISVSGKYSVITLGKKGLGVSLKLTSNVRDELSSELKETYQKLLKDKESELFGQSFCVILRTEILDLLNSGVSKEELSDLVYSDMSGNLKDLSTILKNGRTRTSSSCLYKQENDTLDSHITKAKNFLTLQGIEDVNVINESVVYSIKTDIEKLMHRKIWLKSGAFLIIEQLESFNAIDVNTGKAISGKKDIIKKVNEEAALEIMRQIRLRNLTGMILIDFINMKDKDAVEDLCNYVRSLCRKEAVHTQFIDITGLGIVELTRNKNDKSLKEILENHNNTVDNMIDQ